MSSFIIRRLKLISVANESETAALLGHRSCPARAQLVSQYTPAPYLNLTPKWGWTPTGPILLGPGAGDRPHTGWLPVGLSSGDIPAASPGRPRHGQPGKPRLSRAQHNQSIPHCKGDDVQIRRPPAKPFPEPPGDEEAPPL